MQSETPNRKKLLAEQLETLRQMAGVYRGSRASFVEQDLPSIQSHVAALDELSLALRHLNRQIAGCPSSFSDRELQRDVLLARADVQQLNRVFMALVRRSLQSVTVLLNVMTSATGNAAGNSSNASFHAYV